MQQIYFYRSRTLWRNHRSSEFDKFFIFESNEFIKKKGLNSEMNSVQIGFLQSVRTKKVFKGRNQETR